MSKAFSKRSRLMNNCFIAYNSLKDGMQDQSIQITEGTWVTNPLSWETLMTRGFAAPAHENDIYRF